MLLGNGAPFLTKPSDSHFLWEKEENGRTGTRPWECGGGRHHIPFTGCPGAEQEIPEGPPEPNSIFSFSGFGHIQLCSGFTPNPVLRNRSCQDLKTTRGPRDHAYVGNLPGKCSDHWTVFPAPTIFFVVVVLILVFGLHSVALRYIVALYSEIIP